MRKVVLFSLIMMLFAMPCMAQEPNCFIYDTIWFVEFEEPYSDWLECYFYFWVDGVYRCESPDCNPKIWSTDSWLIDVGFVSIFHHKEYNGILIPLIGIGFGTYHYEYSKQRKRLLEK